MLFAGIYSIKKIISTKIIYYFNNASFNYFIENVEN